MDIRKSFWVVALLAGATTASAQDREGTWDVGFTLFDTSGESMAGQSGAALDVDGDLGWGFTTSYNITNRLAIGGDFLWLSPDYKATQVIDNAFPIADTTVSVDAELDVATLHLKGTFNFLDGDFTPFVEAGGGWTRVDSNIADGPPTTGCWWDPWWGYVCTNFYDTYAETQTSWAYSVGLRWDASADFVVRASYGIWEVDSNRSEDFEVDVLRLEFGWRF